MVEILELNNEEIMQIKPLWQKLNQHHKEVSVDFKDHFDKLTFEKRIKKKNDADQVKIFAAKEKNQLTGYLMASIKDYHGEIDSLYIDKPFRKKNTASKLIEKAETWFKNSGVMEVEIQVAAGNESVHGFYMKYGYKTESVRFQKNI